MQIKKKKKKKKNPMDKASEHVETLLKIDKNLKQNEMKNLKFHKTKHGKKWLVVCVRRCTETRFEGLMS